MPAIVEANDSGMYVVKFRGAGQGVKALIAELLAGEIARALDLPVPEIVLIDVDPDLARTEPDAEIQHLLKTSAGLNLALDYLPGSITFDPLVEQPDALLASKIVWFDAFVSNVDRTPRNTNMLIWHHKLRLIDHGAALYFHHGADDFLPRATLPFAQIKDHVLLHLASALETVDAALTARLTPSVINAIAAQIPALWLGAGASDETARESAAQAKRGDYARYFLHRLAAPRTFIAEAIRARDA